MSDGEQKVTQDNGAQAEEQTALTTVPETAEPDTESEAIDLEGNESNPEKLDSRAEIMQALRERYASGAGGNLPSKAILITTVAVFLIGIAGLIVALALQVDWWIRLIIGAVSLALIVVYNFIFKSMNKKKQRENLQYAYEFGDGIRAMFEDGTLQKTLYDLTANAVETDVYHDMFVNGKGDLRVSGKLKNGKELTMRFYSLGVDVEVEGKATYDTYGLLYPDRAASNEMDKDGYARKDKSELFDDIADIINAKAAEEDGEESDYELE